MSMRLLIWRGVSTCFVLVLLAASGCASIPGGKPDPRDRFERFNRSVYAFNRVVDHAILRPAARGYVRITPAPVRASITRFMDNLTYSTTILNDFLQGKPDDGIHDLARLVVNTTIGIGGLFDPASNMGLPRNQEDFGLTLGTWGVPSGPYLMLPFFGPSDLRDAIGLVPDEYTTPRAYIQDPWVRWSLWTVDVVNQRALLLDTDRMLDNAFDPYAILRSAYLQRRDYLLHGANESPADEFPDADTSGSGSAAAPASAPPPTAAPGPAPSGSAGPH